MGTTTTIEWTQHTFNPWWGCTKVSAGCTNCYAETLSRRYGHDVWGKKRRRILSEAHWREPLKWNELAERERTPHRVFCASMADVFEEAAPAAEQARLWALIADTPWLRWQLLTKRPERIATTVPSAWLDDPPKNVWYGTSVEGPEVLERVRYLVKVPATIRFLSVEPLLASTPRLPLRGIHWVIVGGESGPRARPMKEEWVRALRDKCLAAGVPFFFKQWGGQFNKQNGRELDERTWDELPGVETSGWGTRLAETSSIASASGRSARIES